MGTQLRYGVVAVVCVALVLAAGCRKETSDQELLERAAEGALAQARTAIDASDEVADGLKLSLIHI